MTDKNNKEKKKPDGRGKRPRDPNQLAKWIVEQSTEIDQQSKESPPK